MGTFSTLLHISTTIIIAIVGTALRKIINGKKRKPTISYLYDATEKIIANIKENTIEMKNLLSVFHNIKVKSPLVIKSFNEIKISLTLGKRRELSIYKATPSQIIKKKNIERNLGLFCINLFIW